MDNQTAKPDVVSILIEELKKSHERTIAAYQQAYEDMRDNANRFYLLAAEHIQPTEYRPGPVLREEPDEPDPSLTGGM